MQMASNPVGGLPPITRRAEWSKRMDWPAKKREFLLPDCLQVRNCFSLAFRLELSKGKKPGDFVLTGFVTGNTSLMTFLSPNTWRLFPTASKSLGHQLVSAAQLGSDTVYLEVASDPAGEGLAPQHCSPPHFRLQP